MELITHEEQERAEEAYTESRAVNYALTISQVVEKFMGLPPGELEPYVHLADLIGYNEALEEVGVGRALSPGVRVAIGTAILAIGGLIAWRKYGYRHRRHSGKREELPTRADVGHGSEQAAGSGGTPSRSILEDVFTRARVEAERGAGSHTEDQAGKEGISTSRLDAANAGGGHGELGEDLGGGGEASRGSGSD